MQNEKGFSLIEALVTSSVFLVVLAGVYLMVFHYADVSRTEQSRRRMQQETRFLTSHFADELKNAGSVLALTDTDVFLKEAPYFNGIFPLNSDNYAAFPDGIIVATGDHEAVTTLTADYTPGNETIYHEPTEDIVYDSDVGDTYQTGEWKGWRKGDKGIILDPKGYYVFLVEDVPDNSTLTVRDKAVYYSGLLMTYADSYSTKQYYDYATVMGNGITYLASTPEKKTPVIRLAHFSIYLFREVPHKRKKSQMIRQMVRVTDAKGEADVLAMGSPAKVSIISENIWDMQITYTSYGNFTERKPGEDTTATHYFADPTGDSYTETMDLIKKIGNRKLKELNISIVSLSDEFSGKGDMRHYVPSLGDQSPYYLPRGKYSFKILSMEIEPRNFNIWVEKAI
jgi:hypothetical protein